MSWEFLIFGTGVNIFMSAVGALWCLGSGQVRSRIQKSASHGEGQ